VEIIIDTNDTNIIQEIKDFVSSRFHFDVKITRENDNPKPILENNWSSIDKAIRALKVVDEIGGEELRESFDILAKEATHSDYKSARDEYLINKYRV